MNSLKIILLSAALASTNPVLGATVSINLSGGYLFGANGVSESDRLPVSTLCVLVADLDGNGFDPVSAGSGWVGGGDRLIRVSDGEYSAALGGGTLGFDLTAAMSGGAGEISRTLTIDLDQFASQIAPVAIALRWFPTVSAATTNLATTNPTVGTPYGQFSRITPVYPDTTPWLLNLVGGAIYDLDPLVTVDYFGGSDSVNSATASFSVIPEPSSSLLLLCLGFIGYRSRLRRFFVAGRES